MGAALAAGEPLNYLPGPMPDEAERILAVARALGQPPSRMDLLRDALTHRSYANECPHLAPADNERLEFLGDAVVGLVASALLFERFPQAAEGELTRRRADLVCEAALADVARELGIGGALRLGRGEERTGGRDKPRLGASALEACFAALYLAGGLDAAVEAGRALFQERIEHTSAGPADFKSRVQELVQAAGGSAPRYELVGTEGPDHAPVFHSAITVGGNVVGEGRGRSKAEAEQAAAAMAFAALEGPEPERPSSDPAPAPPSNGES